MEKTFQFQNMSTLIVLLLTLFLQCIPSFSFPNNPQSHSDFLLFGDAKFISGSSTTVKLTDPNPNSPAPSSGLLTMAKPIKFLNPNPVSFSADFTFSIGGDGLVFVIVSSDFPDKFSQERSFAGLKGRRYFKVKFDTLGDENGKKRVGVSVGSGLRTSVVLNNGTKLHSWIDYDSSSKRMEIRVGEFGVAQPYDPLLAYRIDFGEMWKNEEVLIGLSSFSEKYLQSSVVYSWNSGVRNVPKRLHSQPLNPGLYPNEHGGVRNVPKWLHSHPVNPMLFSNESGEEEKRARKKRSCVLGFLSGLVFVTGCGALAAFIVMSLWAIITRNKEVVIPAESLVHPGDFRYEKINVVVEDRTGEVKS